MEQQMRPQPEGPGENESGHSEGGGVQALVEGIHDGLMKFSEMASQAAPQVAQKLQAVIQGFEAVVEELVSGGGQQQPPPGPRGPSAGGPGSVPV